MYCGKLFEALDKRLGEKKTIDEIAKEICNRVHDPRGKVIRLIKAHKKEKWLKENAEWLGYHANHTKKSISSKKSDDRTDSDNQENEQTVDIALAQKPLDTQEKIPETPSRQEDTAVPPIKTSQSAETNNPISEIEVGKLECPECHKDITILHLPDGRHEVRG